MQSEESRSTAAAVAAAGVGVVQAQWFFTKVKLALAVAVIKNRPAGTSSRASAEALARQLRSRDESWKEKAQGLQQEVLRLRQEMLIAKVTRSATETAGMDGTSEDLFDPVSDSETPDLLDLVPQRTAPAPVPVPPPPPPSRPPCGPQETALTPHVQFLQSLCGLYRLSGGSSSSGLEALWSGSDGDVGSVLTDSVCQLLDSVVAACREAPPPPPLLGPSDLVLQACQAAARAMDVFCSQRLPSAPFRRRVEETLKELTRMLLHHGDQPGPLEAGEKLMEYLITLGGSNMSKSFLIRHILAQISALADQLWQAFQGQKDWELDQFPVDQYQNSCYLFWIVEELLQKSKVPCRVEVGSEQTGFLSHLEQRVFLLSEEFPLFSISMWRIGGLLTSSDRQDPPPPPPPPPPLLLPSVRNMKKVV